MLRGAGGVPADWYITSFASNYETLYFEEEEGEEKVELAVQILEPRWDDRFLDLACATGKRTLELCRRGFGAVGVDIRKYLLEVGGCEADREGLEPWFLRTDHRRMKFGSAFDFVLSLGGGAFGHFTDEDDVVGLQAVRHSLRPYGRLLMQIPNVLYIEAGLPERTLIEMGEAVEAIEQRWNGVTRRLEGTRTAVASDERPDPGEPEPFDRRVYSVEELAALLNRAQLRLANVFDEEGDPCTPSEQQQQLYALAVPE